MYDSFSYYARNNEEKGFDDWVREKVWQTGTSADQVLYIQNQAIISMLRRIEDKLEELKEN